jgi:F420H(2)-dependent quinone reductase
MLASVGKAVFRLLMNLQVFVYRASKGRFMSQINGLPVLLLTTTGRKSGKTRTTPVLYIHQDNEYLIAASAGGADKNPMWFLNLQSHPEASIEVNGITHYVRAFITTGDERDRLYEVFKSSASNFVGYEKRTTRKIPVIRLQPIT